MFSISTRNTMGAAALALAGCGTPAQVPTQPFDAGNSSFDTGPVFQDTLRPIDRIVAPDTRPTPDVIFQDRNSLDTILPDRPTDASVSPTDALPTPPSLRIQTPTPSVRYNCDFVSGAYRIGNAAYIVCPGDGTQTNKVYYYDTTATGTATASLRLDIMAAMPRGSIANSVYKINDTWVAITTGNVAVPSANGVYIAPTDRSSTVSFSAFPAGNTTPGDAVQIGASLYVTAANFGSTFGTGRVIVYPITPTATIPNTVLGTPISFDTTVGTTNYSNPTGLDVWRSSTGNRLVILCSGPYTDPRRAALLVYNTDSRSMERAIELPGVTATTHFMIEGNLAVVGSSSFSTPDGRFYVIDLSASTASSHEYRITGDRFHAGTAIINGTALLADLNSNHITAFPLSDPTLRTTLATAPVTSVGPSVAVTTNCLDYFGLNAGVRVCVGM